MSREESDASPVTARLEGMSSRIVFHPHARQRMEERGVTEEEIRRAVEEGAVVPARRGRRRHQMAFPFERFRLSKYYRSKLLDVYSVVEGDVIIILTVVAKYF